MLCCSIFEDLLFIMKPCLFFFWKKKCVIQKLLICTETVYSSKSKDPSTTVPRGTGPVTVLVRGRGWTSSTLGHLHTVSIFCRDHGDVTHGRLWEFASSSYSFPQHCMNYRLSVGAGLFTNHFWLTINKHKSEDTFPTIRCVNLFVIIKWQRES
jgi:hypothetical protein